MGALAFVVLQSQTDASRVVTDAIADACDGTDFPTDALARRLRVLEIAARRMRRGVPQTEVQPLLPDITEPAAMYTLRLALLEVSVADRLLLALAHIAQLDVQTIGHLLHMSRTEVGERSNDARNCVQAAVEQEGLADVATPFDNGLGRHLRLEAARYLPVVTVGDVDVARRRNRDVHRERRAAAGAAALVVGAVLAAVIGVRTGLTTSSSGQVDRVPSAAAGARAGDPPGPVAEPGGPIGLADCQIIPADASLAFAGWATPEVLGVQGGDAKTGAPIYAVVTRGLAEWVGWRSSGGAMYPPPIGRMGCAYDPATGVASVVGVSMDWQPPTMTNGCPVSEVNHVGMYRETGGPHGWLLLPVGSGSPTARNPGAPLTFRLSPAPQPRQRVSARIQRIDGSQTIEGEVTPDRTLQRPASAFYDVHLEIPTIGCWVMDMAVNGNVVGAAVVAVDRVFARATPRVLPIVP